MLLGNAREPLNRFPPAGQHLPTGRLPGGPILVPFLFSSNRLPARPRRAGNSGPGRQRCGWPWPRPFAPPGRQQRTARRARGSSLKSMERTRILRDKEHLAKETCASRLPRPSRLFTLGFHIWKGGALRAILPRHRHDFLSHSCVQTLCKT